MLSFEKLKDFLILILIFGIIYWFQQVDDKKRCKKRETTYSYIKLPLLVVSILGLIFFWSNDNNNNHNHHIIDNTTSIANNSSIIHNNDVDTSLPDF